MKAGIVLAGGTGSRFGDSLPKQFLDLNGFPVIYYSVRKFLTVVDRLVVVCHKDYLDRVRTLFPDEVSIVSGGVSRRLSVKAGLDALQEFAPQVVAIHDGARPLFSRGLLIDTLRSAQESGSGIAAVEAKETLCRSSSGEVVLNYISRDSVSIIQTPQSFLYSEIYDIHCKEPLDSVATDDSQLWHKSGRTVFLVSGETSNIKITYPEDIVIAEGLLKSNPDIGF